MKPHFAMMVRYNAWANVRIYARLARYPTNLTERTWARSFALCTVY